MTIKGIRNAAHLTSIYNAWAIAFNPETNEIHVFELVSTSDDVHPANGWHLVSKGSGRRSMKEIEDQINEASYQF